MTGRTHAENVKSFGYRLSLKTAFFGKGIILGARCGMKRKKDRSGLAGSEKEEEGRRSLDDGLSVRTRSEKISRKKGKKKEKAPYHRVLMKKGRRRNLFFGLRSHRVFEKNFGFTIDSQIVISWSLFLPWECPPSSFG